jgi:hypothetical protein
MKDYLEYLNGIVTMIVLLMGLSVFGFIPSKTLQKWYKDFGLLAFLMDCTIFMLCLAITFFIYPYLFSKFELVPFIILAVCVQFVHDILLTWTAFSVKPGKYGILDGTRDYVNEHGITVYIADAILISSAILIAQWMKKYSKDVNIISLLFLFYHVPIFLSSFK